MKMLQMFLIPLLVLGLAVTAGATHKDELLHGPTVVVPRAEEDGRAVGDDCSDPIVIDTVPYYGTGLTTCGRGNNYSDTCLGNYDGGEDIMFRLDLAEDATIKIIMDPLGTGWTGLAVDSACPPAAVCIATNFGSSGVRTISNLSLAAGSYYIMVDTWPSPTCIPNFNLTIEFDDPPPPPPVNDTCEGAIDLQEQGLSEFEVDLCLYQHYYNPGTYGDSCTGWSAMGPEAVYKIFLEEGEFFSACVNPSDGFIDLSLYMVTDCSDPQGSCVAGDDSGNPECISFNAAEAGWYYLMVDTYSTCGAGWTTVTIDAPIATQAESWSSIKSIFR